MTIKQFDLNTDAIPGRSPTNPHHQPIPNPGPSPARPGWIPKGQTVSIHGHQIDGMIYVGKAPTIPLYGYSRQSRAYIDPSYPVAEDAGPGYAMRLGDVFYWHGYEDMPARCRAIYLKWLAAGATDESVGPNYALVYFYGLERRFFFDDPGPAEQQQLMDEVLRLHGMFPTDGIVAHYLREFLEYAVVATTPISELRPVFNYPVRRVPYPVKVAIGARLQTGERLGADWVLSWFLCDPRRRRLRVAATRCPDEFMALFRLRFKKRYPKGMKSVTPVATLTPSYMVASREFVYTPELSHNGNPIPDIYRLRRPVNVAKRIADEVTDDLRALSTYLSHNPGGRDSLDAHVLLPWELRPLFPSAELEKIRAWASGVIEAGGMVPVDDVLERMAGGPPQKFSKRVLVNAGNLLAQLGFGMAPEPRFALRPPATGEPIVLFALETPVERLPDASPAYRSALRELALGCFIAHAGGIISGREWTRLEARSLKPAGLSEHEKLRLGADLAWFVAVPPDLNLLRRELKTTGVDQQPAIRAALVTAATADGVAQPEQVARIEKIYRALGLDATLVYTDLHAGEVADGPRWVQAPQSGGQGEPIPPGSKTSHGELDPRRIANIRKDTHQVSTVLADIFTPDQAADSIADQPAEPATGPAADQSAEAPTGSLLAGLDEKHTALVRQVVTRAHWTEAEFAELATSLGLMTAGALETVNAWAYEVHDEALLDEYDGYDVSPDIIAAQADTFRDAN